MTREDFMECFILLKETALALEPNTDLKRRVDAVLEKMTAPQQKVWTIEENRARQMAERNQPCIYQVLKGQRQYKS